MWNGICSSFIVSFIIYYYHLSFIELCFRQIPVVDSEDRMAGVVSIGDLVSFHFQIYENNQWRIVYQNIINCITIIAAQTTNYICTRLCIADVVFIGDVVLLDLEIESRTNVAFTFTTFEDYLFEQVQIVYKCRSVTSC